MHQNDKCLQPQFVSSAQQETERKDSAAASQKQRRGWVQLTRLIAFRNRLKEIKPVPALATRGQKAFSAAVLITSCRESDAHQTNRPLNTKVVSQEKMSEGAKAKEKE